MKREWHSQVYTAIFWHQIWSPFFYTNALLWQIEIRKNKIQTLKRKEYVFLHSVLSSTYCVCVSVFKEQPPTAGDCCFFFLGEPQYTGMPNKPRLHWIRNPSSAGSRCWGFFALCFFFFSEQSQNRLKKKRSKKTPWSTSLLSSKSCSGSAYIRSICLFITN